MNPDAASMICEKLGIKPGMKVLDVGCGTGIFGYYLGEVTENVSYTGIDLDADFIEAANKKAAELSQRNACAFLKEAANRKAAEDSHRNIYTFLEADASKLPFEDGSFDIVLSHTFLTACYFYEPAFEEMKRVCKKDGIIGSINISDFNKIVNFPGREKLSFFSDFIRYEQLKNRFNSAQENLYPLNSISCGIDPRRIPSFFSANGLSDVNVFPIGSYFSLSNGKSALDKGKKESYIRLKKSAELCKISFFSSLRGFSKYMTTDETGELKLLTENYYDSLLARETVPGSDHCNSQTDNNGNLPACETATGSDRRNSQTDNNDSWPANGYLYLLVIGKNTLAETPGREDSFSEETEDPKNNFPASATSPASAGKYKDCPPEDTIAHIKAILKNLGISTREQLSPCAAEGLYSCRIKIEGTEVGQNGKGTTALFSLASGYAEFMERLATGYLFPFESKDLVWESIDEAVLNGGFMLKKTLSEIYAIPLFLVDVKTLLEKWADNGQIKALPFRSLEDGKIYLLPEDLYRGFVFTNGSCAGNTREEALVQGISEIIERYCSRKILKEKLSPPLIPEAELKRVPKIYKFIKEIENDWQLKLFIFDASLGLGLPVIGAVYIDKKSKKACLRFGCHPRFEIALERTITELVQGRRLNDSINMSPFGAEYESLSDSADNIFNILKLGCGIMSLNLLRGFSRDESSMKTSASLNNCPKQDLDSTALSTNKADWQWKPFEEVSGSNKDLLDHLTGICRAMNWDVYIRDCSFFGFPVYHVFIPDASLILNTGKAGAIRELERVKYKDIFKNLPGASEEELSKAMIIMKLYSPLVIHDSLDLLAGVPFRAELFGIKINYTLMSVLNSIRTGDYKEAAVLLKPYEMFSEEFWCLRQLCLIEMATPGSQDRPAESPRKLQLSQLPGSISDSGISSALCDPKSLEDAQKIFDDPFCVLPECSFPDCTACIRSEICDMAEIINRTGQ